MVRPSTSVARHKCDAHDDGSETFECAGSPPDTYVVEIQCGGTSGRPHALAGSPRARAVRRASASARWGAVAFSWLVASATFGYMLPWAIAVTRRPSRHTRLWAANLMTGWTGIGWIVCLMVATRPHECSRAIEGEHRGCHSHGCRPAHVCRA